MKYRKYVAVCGVAFSLLTAQALGAEALPKPPAATVIAIVDVQKVVKNASAAKMALDEIKKKRDQYQTEINKQEENLKKKDQELAKQKAVLSAEAFEQKRKEFQKTVLEVQQGVQKKRAALDNSYTTVLAEIQKSVVEIIATLSQEKGFDIAIPSSQVLYGKDTLDISDEVLLRLNKKLPKVAIELKE